MTAHRRFLPAILSLVLFAGAIWLWQDGIDVQVIVDRLSNVDPIAAFTAYFLLLVFSPVNAYRLKTITAWVAGAHAPYPAVLRITCIGYFVAATAPIGILGDAAKIGLMRPLVGLTWRDSIQSVLSDRVSVAVFVAGLGALMLPLRVLIGDPLVSLQLDAVVFFLVLTGTALAVLIRTRVPTSPRFFEVIGWMLSAITSLFSNARRVGAQVGFGAANVLLWFCVILLLARGMGVQVSALHLLQFVPIIVLVTSVPLLYLGWGGREMIMVSTVGSLPGVSTNDALSLAISIGALGMLAAVPNGLFLLAGIQDKHSPTPGKRGDAKV